MEFYHHNYKTYDVGDDKKKKTYFIDIPNWLFETNFNRKSTINDIYITVGKAVCNPKDQFCKRVGREVAKSKRIDYLFEVVYVGLKLDKEKELMLVEEVELKNNFYVIVLRRYKGNLTFDYIT